MVLLKIVLTSLLSVLALFIMAKLVGHKQISQLEFFDYITGITVGSIGAELATELENPERPLTAIAVYCLVSVALSFITNKFPKMRRFINGEPALIMKGGVIYRKNMKRAKLDISEFLTLCRESGYFDPDDIDTALFEADGKLTLFPKDEARPLTPKDMKITPKPSGISSPVIMDGHINKEALEVCKWSEKRLISEIKTAGYSDCSAIMLATVTEAKLKIYPKG